VSNRCANLCFQIEGISATARFSVSDKGSASAAVLSATRPPAKEFRTVVMSTPGTCVEGIDRRALQAGVQSCEMKVRGGPLRIQVAPCESPFFGSKNLGYSQSPFANTRLA